MDRMSDRLVRDNSNYLAKSFNFSGEKQARDKWQNMLNRGVLDSSKQERNRPNLDVIRTKILDKLEDLS
eukprot:CAMPEP_0202957378 /NCGR_PEP_ID=MMETSP1396-20130829/1784_1 /ASSEMBLY_ACC=CAM_ASM_000872 /TAXON_ID= /ORGANISM="Pseudokeronopsis sp., Strain Brazil" /LENGTH=68 /DNA_ID=CAMNT_0049674821 /DNA_START=646 /DNA_END=852 /DNA_ORIENTATION=-